MNQLQVVPQPEYFSDYQIGNVCLTPYHSMNWQQVVARYGVEVPEQMQKIVTLVDGISTCPHCGARYQGKQTKCTARVDWHHHQEPGRDWKNSARGYKPVGSRTGNSWSTSFVTDNYVSECGEYCKWDKESEFYEQSNFYNFLSTIPIDDGTNFDKYLKMFKDPKEAELVFLRFKVQNQEMQISRLMGAVEQIANKMNSAGHALSF